MDQANFFGYSMGGCIGFNVADLHPDRLRCHSSTGWPLHRLEFGRQRQMRIFRGLVSAQFARPGLAWRLVDPVLLRLGGWRCRSLRTDTGGSGVVCSLGVGAPGGTLGLVAGSLREPAESSIDFACWSTIRVNRYCADPKMIAVAKTAPPVWSFRELIMPDCTKSTPSKPVAAPVAPFRKAWTNGSPR